MHGWPVLVHYCETCSYNSPVSSPHPLEEAHICAHCGTRSQGAAEQGGSQGTMNQQQHDELARLFERSMHVSHTPSQAPVIAEQVVPMPEKQQHEAVHFVSGHYTQTAHIRPEASPPPPYHEVVPHATAYILRQHSIDPSSLLPAQIDLFENAHYEQRLRLLELWRISPPAYPQVNSTSMWVPTTVEREEVEAKLRFERQTGQSVDAEPYMAQGYQQVLPPAPSVDPVYAASTGLWQSPNYAQPMQQAMEDQYGLYEQIRCHADWERLNEQIAAQKMASMQHVQIDDEMVL